MIELNPLFKNIDHIKEIVSMQQVGAIFLCQNQPYLQQPRRKWLTEVGWLSQFDPRF